MARPPRSIPPAFPAHRRSLSSRSTWTRLGTLVASATVGGALTAALDARGMPVKTPSGDTSLVLGRIERTIGPWELPEHVLASVFPIQLAPGARVDSGRPAALQGPASQDAPVFRFAIPPGPLPAAIQEFRRLTGLTVQVVPDLLQNLTSDGVSGLMTADQALQRLLTGTSLSHRFTEAGQAVVEIRVGADAVEVTAGMPRITAANYPAPVVETPQTIQIIPRALLEEQGATTLSEALRNVPGITMQAGEGGGASNTSGDMFNMRGFSAANSLFVDGVRDDGLIARDVFNLEQIEVFSGPTGSDVGRSNAAGYINLSTKAANLEAARTVSLTYASGGNFRSTFDINQPLAIGARGSFLGNAGVRLNVLWQDGGVAGRDHVERGSRSIAPSVAFGVGTPTRVTLSAQVMRQDNLPDYGLPSAASPVGSLAPTSVLAAAPVDQRNYYGSPDFDYDRVRQDSATVRLEHDFTRNLTLRHQARYNVTEREAVITSIANAASFAPATNLVTLSRQGNERKNSVLSHQTSAIARFATGSVRHEASLGLEVSTEKYNAPGLTGLGTRAPIDLNNPDATSPVVDMKVVPSGALADGKTDTVAFYAFDSFDLGPKVRLTGGVRAETYDIRSHAVTTAGVVTDLAGDGTLVSGKAGVLYRLNARGNVYFSYGSSLTPPGSTNFQLNAAAANQNNPNVDPQESVNYELGSKWELTGGRLQVTGAIFRTENRNVIFVVDSAAIPPVFNQDNGQLVRGVSVSTIGQVTPRWDVSASVQYLDSHARSQNTALNGFRLVLTPELSGNLWTTFRLPHDIRIGGGVRFIGETFVNAANTIVIPGYTIADLLIEAPISNRLTLRVNVNNLTDKVYVRNVNNNGGRYNPGTPRAFLLTTGVRF